MNSMRIFRKEEDITLENMRENHKLRFPSKYGLTPVSDRKLASSTTSRDVVLVKERAQSHWHLSEGFYDCHITETRMLHSFNRSWRHVTPQDKYFYQCCVGTRANHDFRFLE